MKRKDLMAQRNALTFEALCQQFLTDHVRAKRKPATSIGYERLLRKHAVPRFRRVPADELTHSDLDQPSREHPRSANRLIAIISSLYMFAGKRGWVEQT